MNIVRFKGGLGNQMFQYAFMLSLRAHGRDVAASLGYYDTHPKDRRFQLTDVFKGIELKRIDNDYFDEINKKWSQVKNNKKKRQEYLAEVENPRFYIEAEPSCYDPSVYEVLNGVFVGYWQSEKYFDSIRGSIIDDFKFASVSKELCLVRSSVKNRIGVHIRRGDFLHGEHKMATEGICTASYYLKAIDYVREKTGISKLIFFSDDMDYVREQFRFDDAIYCEKNMFIEYLDWYDMYLMSHCAHVIVANSTFSWWGAWLNQSNNHIVVAPQKWSNIHSKPDICPGKWVLM